MIKFTNIINEQGGDVKPRHLDRLRNVNKSSLHRYIKSVTKWLFGGNAIKDGQNLINIVQQDTDLWEQLSYLFYDYNMSARINVYRSISLTQEEIDNEFPEFKNLQQGQTCTLESHKGRAVFSWTTEKEFAQRWHPQEATQFVFQVNNLDMSDYVLYINDVFAEPYVSNMDFLHDLLYVEEPKAYAVGQDVDEFFDAIVYYKDQYEVIVWHQMPLKATLIEINHHD